MMDKYYVSVKPKVYKSGIGLKLCHACKALQSKSLKKKDLVEIVSTILQQWNKQADKFG